MPPLQHWSTLIILSSAACILIEFLIPAGNIGKTMNMVLGIFMLCAVMLPFYNQKINFDFKIKNFELQKQTTEKNFKKTIENQTENIFKSSINSVISGVLKDIKIIPEKIEIFTDKNERTCISITKCKIFVDKRDLEKSEEIKKEIEGKLNIKTEVEGGQKDV